MSAAAVCEVCQLVGQFYLSDGVTFCQGCGAESQDHGQQMVVNEETLGVFDTSVAGTLKTKRIRARKDKAGQRFSEKFPKMTKITNNCNLSKITIILSIFYLYML